jgi:tRNA A-37 threonylcarbamoyl transferase component Bud32
MEKPLLSCERCGHPLPPGLAGMCPGCLLEVGLEPPAFFLEGRFGDYELVEKIAQGGMGVVYKARQISLDRIVALKMITAGELASDIEMLRIQAEAKAVASLRHPNIIPLYEVGAHEEIHYFTMPLMEGGSLADQVSRFHGRFHDAARLVETIARAIHYGHQRGILHRDLKPANVLLDAVGIPYVADFGLAKVLGPEAGVTQAGAMEGTPAYMAPEQVHPSGQSLSVATDVYSLGVILYELLTGRLPFEAESLEGLLALLRDGSPLAPRALQPRLSRDLEAICLKCLEREPARRYGSAAELADDLRCYREGQPIQARPPGLIQSAWMWCRRPLGVTLGWALLVAAVGTAQMVRDQKEELRNAALRTNVFTAPLIADGVLRNLEEQSRGVEDMARRPEFVAALQARDQAKLESFCRDSYEEASRGPGASIRGAPFGRVFVEDMSGITLARWPRPGKSDNEFLGKKYSWRDYFKGAQSQVQTKKSKAYISRAYTSESDGRTRFALSVPVYSEDAWLGVLSTVVVSDSALGSLQLNEPGASNHTVTLVSLIDRNRDGDLPHPYKYAVIIHDQIKQGWMVPLKDEFGKQIEQALSAAPPLKPGQPPFSGGRVLQGYRDPVSDEPELAAFAPVGNTPLVVIMQTREQAALSANARLAHSIAWWSLPFALGIGLVWLVFWGVRSRSLGQRKEPV